MISLVPGPDLLDALFGPKYFLFLFSSRLEGLVRFVKRLWRAFLC